MTGTPCASGGNLNGWSPMGGGPADLNPFDSSDTRFALSTQGGATFIFSWNAGTQTATCLYEIATDPILEWSWTQPKIAYGIEVNASGHQVLCSFDTTSTSSAPSCNVLYDYSNCDAAFGQTQESADLDFVTVSQDDQTFMSDAAVSRSQGYAGRLTIWNRTNGCYELMTGGGSLSPPPGSGTLSATNGSATVTSVSGTGFSTGWGSKYAFQFIMNINGHNYQLAASACGSTTCTLNTTFAQTSGTYSYTLYTDQTTAGNIYHGGTLYGTWNLTCANCTLPGGTAFGIHDTVAGKGGAWVKFTTNGGDDINPPIGPNSSNTAWYAWQVSSTTVTIDFSDDSQDCGSGHSEIGYNTIRNVCIGVSLVGTGNIAYVGHALSAPQTQTVIAGGWPAASSGSIDGWHPNWANDNSADTAPIVSAWANCSDAGGQTCNTQQFAIPAGYYYFGEIDAFAQDGSGTIWRLAHNYNTGTSNQFSCKYNAGQVSADGKFYIWETDWDATVGTGRCDTFIATLPLNSSAPAPPAAALGMFAENWLP
jgi:hypothetical protein